MAALAPPLTRRHKAGVRPVRLYPFDPGFLTTVRRTVGWRATCSCGFRSRTYRTRPEAQAHARWHEGGHR